MKERNYHYKIRQNSKPLAGNTNEAHAAAVATYLSLFTNLIVLTVFTNFFIPFCDLKVVVDA